MSLSRSLATSLALVCLLLVPHAVFAQTVLTAQGTAIIENGNVTQAEKTAIQDAYNKAILLEALKNIPQSNVLTTARKLPLLLAARGMQDVIQYKINSRSQQANNLALTVEFKIKDTFLRDWITTQNLEIPSIFRPRILIAITSNAPGEGQHEWWNMKGKKGYSIFENQLASELALWGENVFREAPNLGALASGADPQTLAAKFHANMLLQGTLKYAPAGPNISQYTLNLTLLDVNSKTALGSWTLSRKGDLPQADMFNAIITFILEDLRSRIGQKVAKVTPMVQTRQVCIDGIKNFSSYQKIIDTLSGIEGVDGLEINTISGHSICNTMRSKTNFEDVMQTLQSKRVADIDIQVKDDTAYIMLN